MPIIFFAQTKQFNLTKSNCQLFNGSIYTFGISSQNKNTACTIYKLNQQLNITDSFSVDLNKVAPDNFLLLYSDTLHGFLNVYLQRKDKKLITVLRFNKLFEHVVTIDNVDVARLNSISNFENELFYYKNDVYTIKNQIDTSGKQFYLNKYTLKSELKNFDYEPIWQFPFERKNINSAHIFYTDSNLVLLYVNVLSGAKSGQWILKINSKTGKLIRGTKLNDKAETNTYQYGTFLLDTATKTLSFIGQRFTESQFNQQANKLTISNSPFASIYLIEIDSAGEVLSKQDFKLPINEPKTTSKKITINYILKFNSLIKSRDGSFSFESDIYKNSDNSLCYFYANTAVYNLLQDEETLMLERATLSSNLLIEKYYFNNDKLDMNGKLCIDSLSQFETLFYKRLTLPVKIQFKIHDDNANWLLTRSDIKKNSINYTILRPENKIYQLAKIDEILKQKDPCFIPINSNLFLIATQEEGNKFQLKITEW
ncbi:MAG: hypothetical protein Q7W45_16120 [Bacteroidota bacterium]|nr:hypothetical protein [Bacteroidota bacterium]MDP3145457.1 hypothetical protein [Bacteroidota bacterium]